MEYRKYRDPQKGVAVLITANHGAGWSTWAEEEEGKALLFDHRIVERVLAGTPPDELEKFVRSLGYTSYLGGAENLRVCFVPEGTKFAVREYDGFESLIFEADLSYIA